uniref:Uncharacterized protein n=1 Tax=Rhizophora mucronata TaxID=61149 RepID=A0A2P2L2M2_RHIMU
MLFGTGFWWRNLISLILKETCIRLYLFCQKHLIIVR